MTGRGPLAICYELSVEAHSELSLAQPADLYLASVAKSAQGVERAHERMAHIAQAYRVTTAMVNAIGPADEFVCAGGSAVWSPAGHCTSSLDDAQEGLLVFECSL